MTNSELESILRKAPGPERPAGHWERFTNAVLVQIGRPGGAATVHVRPESLDLVRAWTFLRKLRLALVAGTSAGLACLAIIVFRSSPNQPGVEISKEQFVAARIYCRELEKLFPGQIRSIVFDQSGPHVVLSDTPNIPASPAVFLKICAGKNCQSIITFSGQSISLNGQQCEVLVDGTGGVILAGPQVLWTNRQGPEKPGRVRIEAKPLEAS